MNKKKRPLTPLDDGRPVSTIIIGNYSLAEKILREAKYQGKLNREVYDWFLIGKGANRSLKFYQVFLTSITIMCFGNPTERPSQRLDVLVP